MIYLVCGEKVNEKEYFITQEDIDKIEIMDKFSIDKITYDEAFSIIKTYKELLENEYN